MLSFEYVLHNRKWPNSWYILSNILINSFFERFNQAQIRLLFVYIFSITLLLKQDLHKKPCWRYERKQRQKINNFYIKHVLTPNIFFAVKIQRYCFRELEKNSIRNKYSSPIIKTKLHFSFNLKQMMLNVV